MEVFSEQLSETVVKMSFCEAITTAGRPVTGDVEFDIENQGKFVELLETILDQHVVHVILDMQSITYIDSSGLWALFEGYRKVQKLGMHLVLYHVTKDVKRVLTITQLASKFIIVDDEPSALSRLEADA